MSCRSPATACNCSPDEVTGKTWNPRQGLLLDPTQAFPSASAEKFESCRLVLAYPFLPVIAETGFSVPFPWYKEKFTTWPLCGTPFESTRADSSTLTVAPCATD